MSKIIQSKYYLCKGLCTDYKNIWGGIKPSSFRSTKVSLAQSGYYSYKNILNAKQVLKRFYVSISECRFKKFMLSVTDTLFRVSHILINCFETYLECIIFKSRLCYSLYTAHKYIKQQLITINNIKVVRESYGLLPTLGLLEIKYVHPYWSFNYKKSILGIPVAINLEVDFRLFKLVFISLGCIIKLYTPIKTSVFLGNQFYTGK